MTRPWRPWACGLFLGVGALGMGACDEAAGEATLRVSIYGESYIEDRIPAEEVSDGWEIRFSSFVVSVTDITADDAALTGAYLIELAAPSQGAGHPIGEITVPAGATSHLEYRVGAADRYDGSTATQAQAATMLEGGLSMLVEGTAARDDEVLAFTWGFDTDTHYRHCHIDRELADGASDEAQITIHADHLFYDDLDSEMPAVAFDLMASADRDGDRTVTAAELGTVDITAQSRYQVGSRPIEDLWAFVSAQTGTVGHIDGEGHCVSQ